MEGLTYLQAVKTPSPWGKFYKNIVYCVPTFSNPSGKTMTLSNRQKLVQMARKYDALIITDDVYDCLQFPTSAKTSASLLRKSMLPRLVDIDRTMEPRPQADSFGNTMSNGSFSKIAGPGVRTGWAEATPKFIYGLSQCGSSRSGGAPSQMTATIVSELLRSGDLENHIETVLKPAYKKRYETMIDAINTSLVPQGVKVGEVSYGEKAVFGGYFIWLELPEGVTAGEVTEMSKQQENLIVAPGRLFEVLADPSVKFNNSIRLCFAWEEEVDLKEGVVRLGRVIKDVQEGVPWKQNMAAKDIVTKKDLGEFK
jgi:DNA-binding transcriptional MocR family regulator